MNSFQIIDTNEDGRISKQELRNAAFLIGLNPTKRELETWWREADTNSKCLIIYIYIEKISSMFKDIKLIQKTRLETSTLSVCGYREDIIRL